MKSNLPLFRPLIIILFLIILCSVSEKILAQWHPTPNDTLTSFSLQPDNSVIFRIYAPNADTVHLGGTDIPDLRETGNMVKQDNGVWTVTIGSLKPGAYRYNFNVDGVNVIDPRNPLTSQSNLNTWSLMYISGKDFMDTKNVPHGAVAEITYFSNALKRFRRMHVYTPPGYQSGNDKYPVFYLLHGAFDCDDSWTTVGRAGFIFDNLIADKKIKPMVVIMPAGHTGSFRLDEPGTMVDEFVKDFMNDIMPYAEKHYRVHTDPKYRAIAGLSMGGAQTLNVAIVDLSKFGYIGVFSSGIFGITGNPRYGAQPGPSWEEQHLKTLDDPGLKKELALLWFATGKEDFLLETSRATVELFKKHNFEVIYHETEGAHTWENWRLYLHEFSQLLFK